MYVCRGEDRVVIATDWRLKSDVELDESEPNETPHVLSYWRLGRYALGPRYRSVTRIALFDYSETPSLEEAARRRARFVEWIAERRPRRLLVIPTPDSTLGAEAVALKGTHCWQALRAPDTLEAMRGTRWAYNADTEVVPLFPLAKRVKELQRWLMVQWLRAADAPTLKPDESLVEIHPGYAMHDLLHGMKFKPLAVDLEFNPSADIVTAIGLSDGRRSVSVPWDRYLPRNNVEHERGLSDYTRWCARIVEVLRDLLAAPTPKVAHNFVADIPRLEARLFKVGGPVHDTFAAHAIAYPELRHGLQHAASSLLPCPPWKSLYKPSGLNRGITRDDAEFWIADPLALRRYNARDAFYTWHLAQAVLPQVEVNFAA